MLGIKRKGMWQPYGNLIPKFLEHTRLNYRNEEFEEDVTKIGEVSEEKPSNMF